MSDEPRSTEEPLIRELEREERRLGRLRSVVELFPQRGDDAGDDDPDPREAA
jgi:hypothetical protein